MRKLTITLALSLLSAWPAPAQTQVNDPDFLPRVEHPAFTKKHPRVGVDAGHRNFHTHDGRYKPFAALMEADGYRVSAAPPFDAQSLKSVEILVIANAMGPVRDGVVGPAFTPAECDAVRDWVMGGGSLLLIADHAPYGDAASILAERFGVNMGRGFVADPKRSEGNVTVLVFSAENGLLGDHAILRGREPSETIRRVVAFTGQSLSVPANAAVLLKIGSGAIEAVTAEHIATLGKGILAGGPVEGRAQGIAMRVGKGRVAMFGEAAMFSAQVVAMNGQSFKMGMNIAGNDDRQLALNVMHWLAGLLN